MKTVTTIKATKRSLPKTLNASLPEPQFQAGQAVLLYPHEEIHTEDKPLRGYVAGLTYDSPLFVLSKGAHSGLVVGWKFLIEVEPFQTGEDILDYPLRFWVRPDLNFTIKSLSSTQTEV